MWLAQTPEGAQQCRVARPCSSVDGGHGTGVYGRYDCRRHSPESGSAKCLPFCGLVYQTPHSPSLLDWAIITRVVVDFWVRLRGFTTVGRQEMGHGGPVSLLVGFGPRTLSVATRELLSGLVTLWGYLGSSPNAASRGSICFCSLAHSG
jgi:hypothetical protein